MLKYFFDFSTSFDFSISYTIDYSFVLGISGPPPYNSFKSDQIISFTKA